MNAKTDDFSDEINLRELLEIFWKKKLFIAIVTTIFAISSVVYSLSLPNIYTSKALLAPLKAENALSSKLGSLSSIASLPGINLNDESSGQVDEAIARIESFEFFSSDFLPNIKLEDLMAAKEWDPVNKILIYKESFNKNTNKWTRNVSFPKKIVPSDQEAFKKYKDILSILKTDENFIILSISHQSPVLAKNWIDLIILNINETMREKDVEKANKAIIYLNKSASSVKIKSLQDAISNLLESQMQILMLAASSDVYIFDILDSPVIPEEKSSPRRSIICILATIIGGFLSLVLVLISHYTKKNN